jgi:hypothetical protein
MLLAAVATSISPFAVGEIEPVETNSERCAIVAPAPHQPEFRQSVCNNRGFWIDCARPRLIECSAWRAIAEGFQLGNRAKVSASS